MSNLLTVSIFFSFFFCSLFLVCFFFFFLLFFQHVAVFPLFIFLFFFFIFLLMSHSPSKYYILFLILILAISSIVYSDSIPCHDGMPGPRHQIILCCIAMIQLYTYTYRNIVNTIMTTNTLL